MHIPDGFLSPQTCAVAWAVSAPVWYIAWTRIKSRFDTTAAAHIGLAGAFVFLLQMINVPIPGGTSGHATGAALVTIALGPAAGILAVSLALLLQAVVFGDGGIWAFGANVLSMAIVQSAVAWTVWRLIVKDPAGTKLRSIGAFIAAWTAVVCGGHTTGLMLGAQPALFTGPDGPLYFPLGFSVSVPAMVIGHILIGVIEAAITLGAIHVLARLPDFQLAQPLPVAARKKLYAAVAIMAFLVPAGIFLPMLAGAGDPWGEWSPEETAEIAGQTTVPAGMIKYSDNYPAPVPDYAFTEPETAAGESIQYVGSAILGVILVILLMLPLHKMQQRRLPRTE